MARSINRVTLVGNLTRDPELKQLPSGTAVCSLRLAVNDSVKDRDSGEWRDQPNYFDIDVFGSSAENCSKYLSKGRQVAVDGRLRWREWTDKEGGKRQTVSVAADTVQFIGPRDGGQSSGGSSYDSSRSGAPISGNANRSGPAQEDYIEDDDIPF